MWTPDAVLETLRARGELWTVGPGLVGLRGPARELFAALDRAIASLAAEETPDEWRVPQALPLETLARAEYFSSFPQWLTLAAHLRDEPAELERVARAPAPAELARAAVAPADAALQPAVCYHAYAALADRTLPDATRLTAQATCWRHEGARLAPLERGWAFTMREIVCLGDAKATAAFRARLMARVTAFAEALGLAPRVAEATDPFFAPTAEGRAVLQRLKALKQELLLPLGNRETAAASFNAHERFFGDAFAIRTPDGIPADTACVAFGLERWLLAVLCAYGPAPDAWPAIPIPTAEVCS